LGGGCCCWSCRAIAAPPKIRSATKNARMKRKPHTALRFCVIFTFHYLSGRGASSETREIGFQHTVFKIGFQIAWNGFTAVLPGHRKCKEEAVRGFKQRQAN